MLVRGGGCLGPHFAQHALSLFDERLPLFDLSGIQRDQGLLNHFGLLVFSRLSRLFQQFGCLTDFAMFKSVYCVFQQAGHIADDNLLAAPPGIKQGYHVADLLG